ncbi:cell surface protein [Candidatus Woesearchaeota archaeon]|nr:cell surface protein [Candidatus Woesearchaeota archaeon]
MAAGDYLSRALATLEQLGITLRRAEEDSQLVHLLDEMRSVDEPRIVAVAQTVQHISAFNELVRDNVGEMNSAQRYQEITGLFDSIREDSKILIAQLADGTIDFKERAANLWMRVRRGTPHDRFNRIASLYNAVSEDTRKQLERESEILDAYADFRFALKNAGIMSLEVLQAQEGLLVRAKGAYSDKEAALAAYSGADEAEKARMQLARDEAARAFQEEDRRYQLIKDVAENLNMGYNVGETLVAKLSQTHGVKEQVYRRAVTFFTTNSHVFTTLDAVYTSQHGLHEATQTLDAMAQGMNRGLEDVAGLGDALEKAALKAGYGSTYSPDSVRKLVDAIVSFQEESLVLIEQYRAESSDSAREIGTIVQDGKARLHAAVQKYLSGPQQRALQPGPA